VTRNRRQTRNRSIQENLARRRPLAMNIRAFSWRNAPDRARIGSSDCGSAGDCGSPDCGRQKFAKKKRIFFSRALGTRVSLRSTRLSEARFARLASLAAPHPPAKYYHSVRVGHGRFFGEKNNPPPENGRGAKQVPLRVRVGSERGPAQGRGLGHRPARRQVEGPESGRVP
jgi:hypothetical protein